MHTLNWPYLSSNTTTQLKLNHFYSKTFKINFNTNKQCFLRTQDLLSLFSKETCTQHHFDPSKKSQRQFKHKQADHYNFIHPVNNANLRDFIAVTGLVVLLKLDSNRWFFSLYDHKIWWMTSTNNGTPFLHYIKLCASFQIHSWIQTGVTVWKHSIQVKIGDFVCPMSAWNFMDDLGKQLDTSSIQSNPVISRLLGAKIRERELSGSPVISRCRAKITTREFRITDPHSQAFTTL